MSKRFYLLLAVAAIALIGAYNITAPSVIADQAPDQAPSHVDGNGGADQIHDEQVYEREKCVENCA